MDGRHLRSAPRFTIGARRTEHARDDVGQLYDHQQQYLRSRQPSAPAVSLKGRHSSADSTDERHPKPGPTDYANQSQITRKGQPPIGGGPGAQIAARRAQLGRQVLARRPSNAAASPERPRQRREDQPMHALTDSRESYLANVAKAASYLNLSARAVAPPQS